MKKTLILIGILIILLIGLNQVSRTNFQFQNLFQWPWDKTQDQTQKETNVNISTKNRTVVEEESAIIDVIDKTLPSVVTVGIKKTTTTGESLQFDPFNPFGPLRRIPEQEETIEQNIGSGFIISKDGLIITNRHVVSDTEASYEVLTNDEKRHDVQEIYRDPLNDLAILKINANNLTPLELADSSKLKLGQIAIAIGTPLGEFTNTVTTGIVSGLGRGITAGSSLEGFVEQLDDVIQTDAAINPGNSGGPLLNSSGQVIGINTAISGQGQNIGFAIPSNVVRDIIQNFEERGGTFERPYIGVRYRMISKQTALTNDVVEGAYIIDVVAGSPADEADLQEDDIITALDGQKLDGDDEESLARIILQQRIGETISIELWRDGTIINKQITLEAFE